VIINYYQWGNNREILKTKHNPSMVTTLSAWIEAEPGDIVQPALQMVGSTSGQRHLYKVAQL
jgi:hypothetical protein